MENDTGSRGCKVGYKHEKEGMKTCAHGDVRRAMEESFARYKAHGVSKVRTKWLAEAEFAILLNTILAAVQRDDSNREFNKRVRGRRGWLTMVGVVCLLCPILVAFDVALSVTCPRDLVMDILGSVAQERGVDGVLARACLKIVGLSVRVALADRRQGGTYVAACFGALGILLVIVRRVARCRVVMSACERQYAACVVGCLRRELGLQRVGWVEECAGVVKVKGD